MYVHTYIYVQIYELVYEKVYVNSILTHSFWHISEKRSA